MYFDGTYGSSVLADASGAIVSKIGHDVPVWGVIFPYSGIGTTFSVWDSIQYSATEMITISRASQMSSFGKEMGDHSHSERI